MTKINLPPIPSLDKDWCNTRLHGPWFSTREMYAYGAQAAHRARSDAIEDVAAMICRRFDLSIPADLGPKLLEAIRSLSTTPEKDHGEPS